MAENRLTRSCRDTFIYEYVGDVVNQPSLLKRMRQYVEEGIQHFYFMALQKDEVTSVAISSVVSCIYLSSLPVHRRH